MSTHFRPRPPSAPTSPVRPSTAHSTIRAVTPSPPHDLPRPKSAHAVNSPDLTTFAHYVLKSDDSNMFRNTPPTARPGSGVLRRSGARTSRSASPVKARARRSPTKAQAGGSSTPGRTRDEVNAGNEDEEADTGSSSDAEPTCPSTPTPMTLEQKRKAYTPLCLPSPPPPSFALPINTSPPIPRKSSSRISHKDRLSVSGASNTTALSAASKNSIFSTPGRDELERKKALVETDEGPFGRATSVADLREERRRVSGGRENDGTKEEGGRKGKMRGCVDWEKCECVVM